MEIERFLHHGLVGRSGLPQDVLVHRKALAHAEIEHFTKLLDDPPIGVQIGIVTDTLPHSGFQIFRQPVRKILVLSPFRLGSEPNVRVGVAMITSAPDALAFHKRRSKKCGVAPSRARLPPISCGACLRTKAALHPRMSNFTRS